MDKFLKQFPPLMAPPFQSHAGDLNNAFGKCNLLLSGLLSDYKNNL